MLRMFDRLRQQQVSVVADGGIIAITINHLMIDSDLTDYTFILDQNFASVFTDTNGILDADGTNPMLADGGDLIISTTADGLNRIPVDPRDLATANDTANAVFEIACKLPFVSSSVDTTFYILWGGSETAQPLPTDTYGQYNAYDDDYVLVSPAGGDDCRTRHGHISEIESGSPVAGDSEGLVGRATHYNRATSDTMKFADDDSLSFTDGAGNDYPHTFEMSIKREGALASGVNGVFVKGTSISVGEYHCMLHHSSLYYRVMDNSGAYMGRTATGQAGDVWEQYALTYNGNGSDTDMTTFKDGILKNTTTSNSGTYTNQKNTSYPLYLGRREVGNYYTGLISDLRLSKVVRSTSHISATNNNLKNTAGFLTVAPANVTKTYVAISDTNKTGQAVIGGNGATYSATFATFTLAFADPTYGARDLVASNEEAIYQLFNDITDKVIVESTDGWITDEHRKVTLESASGLEHNGDINAGVGIEYSQWNQHAVTTDDVVDVELHNLKIKNTRGDGQFLITGVNTKNYNLLAQGGNSHFKGVYFYNCLSLDVGTSFMSEDRNSKFYNCVSKNTTVASYKAYWTGAQSIVQNCVAINPTTAFDGTFSPTSSNNASTDGSTLGANSLVNIIEVDCFVDPANDDYHLKAGSPLIGAGYNLTGTNDTDIDGETYTVPYPIGFDKI